MKPFTFFIPHNLWKSPRPSNPICCRAMDVAALADTPWSKELEAAVKKEFDTAEGLFKKALDVKADYFDAFAHLAGDLGVVWRGRWEGCCVGAAP